MLLQIEVVLKRHGENLHAEVARKVADALEFGLAWLGPDRA